MGPSVLTDTDSKLRTWGGDKDVLLQVCVKGQRLRFLRAWSRTPPPYGKELVFSTELQGEEPPRCSRLDPGCQSTGTELLKSSSLGKIDSEAWVRNEPSADGVCLRCWGMKIHRGWQVGGPCLSPRRKPINQWFTSIKEQWWPSLKIRHSYHLLLGRHSHSFVALWLVPVSTDIFCSPWRAPILLEF